MTQILKLVRSVFKVSVLTELSAASVGICAKNAMLITQSANFVKSFLDLTEIVA